MMNVTLGKPDKKKIGDRVLAATEAYDWPGEDKNGPSRMLFSKEDTRRACAAYYHVLEQLRQMSTATPEEAARIRSLGVFSRRSFEEAVIASIGVMGFHFIENGEDQLNLNDMQLAAIMASLATMAGSVLAIMDKRELIWTGMRPGSGADEVVE